MMSRMDPTSPHKPHCQLHFKEKGIFLWIMLVLDASQTHFKLNGLVNKTLGFCSQDICIQLKKDLLFHSQAILNLSKYICSTSCFVIYFSLRKYVPSKNK